MSANSNVNYFGSEKYDALMAAIEDEVNSRFSNQGDLSAFMLSEYQASLPSGDPLGNISVSTFDGIESDLVNFESVMRNAQLANELATGGAAGITGTVAQNLAKNNPGNPKGILQSVLQSRGLSASEIDKVAQEYAKAAKALAKTAGGTNILLGTVVLGNDLANGNGEFSKDLSMMMASALTSGVIAGALGNAAFVAGLQAALASSIGAAAAAAAIGALTSPVIIAALAIGAGIVAAHAIGENWDAIEDFYNSSLGTLEDVLGAIGSTIDNVMDGLGGALDDATKLMEDFLNSLRDDLNEIADYLSDLWDLFDDAEASSSPLVLDLDGDGIELISVNSSDAVYWDIDLDGFAEASGWVKGDDGLLAIDLNNDGIINNSSELFGDQTGHENGFLALAAYDSNNDGLITSTDVEWENLIVWRDINGNGYSEASEQFSLDSLLITQINLGYTDVNYTIAGNAIKQSSTFTMNGNNITIGNAANDNFITAFKCSA